jgi:hypothetical protein
MGFSIHPYMGDANDGAQSSDSSGASAGAATSSTTDTSAGGNTLDVQA